MCRGQPGIFLQGFLAFDRETGRLIPGHQKRNPPLSLFNELKRRNVFKVGIAYVVLAWLVAQVLQLVFESFGSPDWVMKTVLALLAAGWPFALFFAWAFEMTPDGLKRESEVDRSQSITSETGRKLNYTITAILVAALAYFAYDKFVLDATRDAALVEAIKQEVAEQVEEQAAELPRTQAEPDKSIAVLPFVNMSGDEENEYFSDGLTEELLNSLARIKELKVTGRTSSFAFKGQNSDLRKIGKELNVAHILEGSVRKAQNRVRITAQLIKVDDGYHLWSDTFNRELDDIFAIQEEIATRVAGELTTTLLGTPTGQLVHLGTHNAEAYETYLRGRYLFLRSPDDLSVLEQADQLYKQALEYDPQFSLAWVGRFFVLSRRQRTGIMNFQEGARQMRKLAEKIYAMDPELPDSQLVLGRIAMVELNWNETEAAYRQALDLAPGDVTVLSAMAGLMAVLDRRDEALELALTALARDPLNLQAARNVARGYSVQGRCEEAEKITLKAQSILPEASRFGSILAFCWMFHRAEYEKAIDLLNREPVGFLKETGLAITYNKMGKQDQAQKHLDILIADNGEAASYQYAQVYAQWGEIDTALDHLEHAWEIRDSGFILIKSDDSLDPLRDHPRFKTLLEIWKDPSKR